MLVAAITLIAASVAYSRHELGNPLHDQAHCDLCLLFAGAAGAPTHGVIPGRPVLAIRVAPATAAVMPMIRRKAGIYLPRGPPHSFEPI